MRTQTFDPTQFLTKIKGNDYLEVKWRLYWLRDVYPDAQIVTEIVGHAPGDWVIVRATVTLFEDGKGSMVKGKAVGHKMVTAARAKEQYVEYAETGAIGRALGMLGFGTEFSGNDYSTNEVPNVSDVPAPTPIRNTAPQSDRAHTVDQETGEIMLDPDDEPEDEDDEPIEVDPDELLYEKIAHDLKVFVSEQIDAGFLQMEEVTNAITSINEQKSRIAEMTNSEASRFEQWLHGLLDERGAN